MLWDNTFKKEIRIKMVIFAKVCVLVIQAFPNTSTSCPEQLDFGRTGIFFFGSNLSFDSQLDFVHLN